MKPRLNMRWLVPAMMGLTLGAFTITPVVAFAGQDEKEANQAYIEHVVSSLRSQVVSMRLILDNEGMKYDDNMVRHAEAFERVFGMVGPMEWHAADAYQHMMKSDAPDKLSEEKFDEFAEISHKAMDALKRSAKRYMRDKNKGLMRVAIDKTVKSCGNCHTKLPEGTVPRLFKGLER